MCSSDLADPASFGSRAVDGLLDLSMTMADKQDRYSATLFVKNALDKSYVTSISSLPSALLPGGYVQFLPKTYERTFGITVSYHYL